MNVKLPDEPDWRSSSLFSGSWRLFLLVGRVVTDAWAGETNGTNKVRATGLVLKPTLEHRTFIRVGVLADRDAFELKVKEGNRRAQLWRSSPERGFDCKWHNIKLI